MNYILTKTASADLDENSAILLSQTLRLSWAPESILGQAG